MLDWPDITPKKMFSHHCYQTNQKLITFIETKGIVITKLSQTEREVSQKNIILQIINQVIEILSIGSDFLLRTWKT